MCWIHTVLVSWAFPPGLWPQFPCRPRSAEAQPGESLRADLPLRCPPPWSAGQQEPEGPHSGGPHGGHLTNFQLKSLSFLKSLKLDQQKQERALTLLQQRAEQEVWETQMALDELVFKHQLEVRRLPLLRP